MLLNFVDLKQKEIINIVDGKKLGYPDDFIFDSENTRIKSFTIPGESKAFGFKKTESKTINLEDIFLIGDDVILVNLPTMAVKSDKEQPKEPGSYVFTPKQFKRVNK
ncbi:MAG: YlmC/YmxH family sporulation protein [Christensenellales bacterium]